MSRFIHLHASVTRCRPELPLTKLENDCGNQDRCARRMAANTVGAPQRDFSKESPPAGNYVWCTYYLAVQGAENVREEHDAKTMQEPT